ncbi:DUF6678 family protein [Bacillus changyiensis]|uniref:DUF6678 family protein n=1 Tax=Bacillus changyiensis TaxID=3004103 RepID=UPI0022E50691|nr:DUF6678 family protein [Bacillus changyiensis]MDA1475600.1 hypothetical protein [Bacillus changyiensis]
MDEKQKVLAVVNKKQLASIMNNTKWEQLQKFVIDNLPFPPAFQVKYVLEDPPDTENFEEDVWYWGDWQHGLGPFYSIEWMRVRPRYVKHRGRLIEPEIFDITDPFIDILQKLNIPFVQEGRTICIYGYVNSTEIFNLKP